MENDAAKQIEFMRKCMLRVDRITLIYLCSDRGVSDFRMTDQLINRAERIRYQLQHTVDEVALKWLGKRIVRLEKEASNLVVSRAGTFHTSLDCSDGFVPKGEAVDGSEAVGCAVGLDA